MDRIESLWQIENCAQDQSYGGYCCKQCHFFNVRNGLSKKKLDCKHRLQVSVNCKVGSFKRKYFAFPKGSGKVIEKFNLLRKKPLDHHGKRCKCLKCDTVLRALPMPPVEPQDVHQDCAILCNFLFKTYTFLKTIWNSCKSCYPKMPAKPKYS